MINIELEQLQENEDWQRVLLAYQQQQAAALIANPEDEGWVFRLKEVPQVETSNLSVIHGKLIALGFLKFELASNSSGVQYQLTRTGKTTIKSLEQLQANAA